MLYKIRKFFFGSKLIRAIKNEDFFINNILDWFYDKYTDLIIVPYETICRFLYWGWKLRNNYEWDCSSNTYYMFYLKFDSLIKYSKKHAHLMWNSDYEGKDFRKLRIACELAKRLYEDDYNTHTDEHNKKWKEDNEFDSKPNFKNGKIISYSLDWKSEQNLTKKELEQKGKEFRIAYNLDNKQKESEKKYLFKILTKHLEGWWD